MSVALAVNELRKSYGAVQAVRGISFEARTGEIYGLLGPNGAGKTSTIECIIGLRTPDMGSVTVCDIDALRYPRQVKQRIGAALQATALPDKVTPREALRLFASFYQRPVAIGDLIARFSLAEKADAKFETLSGGQKQRLAIALAVINDPDVLFLDEPTAGLDPIGAAAFDELIRELSSRLDLTVFLITHDLDTLYSICDRVAVIADHKVVAVGTISELLALDHEWIQEYFRGPRGRAAEEANEANEAEAEALAEERAAQEGGAEG
jgi:phospholipid/cholesterol/gamma-HCH transport system ATP-binding protein